MNTLIIQKSFEFSEWASIFLTMASILIAILLAFNFVYIIKIIEFVKMAKKSANEIININDKLNNFLARIEKLENVPTSEVTILCLKELNSNNENERFSAAQALGEIGNNLHLEALKKALEKEKISKVRDAINKALGKIEERSKKFRKD